MRRALVTGGGSGIGLAIVRSLSDAGFSVSALGRDRSRLERAVEDLDDVRVLACDVTNAEDVAAAVAAAGPVAILVNGAGIVRTAPFAKQSDADWDAMWRTNVMGAVNTIRAVLPGMRDLPSGRIINIASTASLRGYPYVSPYVATKHALLGLTRALALELAPTAVTVNAVCPGYTDTDIVRTAVETIVQKTGRTVEDARTTFTATNPQGRLIDPEEVAGVVRWLVSEEARSVTGQALALAGGEVM